MIRRLSRSACFVCAVLVCLLLLLRHGRAQDCPFDSSITQTLSSISAPLGSNVTFVCRGDGVITWQVRGAQISSELFQDTFANAMIFAPLGDVDSSQLNVTAIEMNDNLPVRCIFDLDPLAPSLVCTEAILTIFGLPGEPENFTSVETGLDQLDLQWDSPVLRENEVVQFMLSATNMDSGEVALNETLVSGNSFTFQRPADDSPCDRYQFDLFAVNSVGTNDTAVSTTSSIPTRPQEFGNITVSVSLDGPVSADLQFTSVSPCPLTGQYPTRSYNLTLQDQMEGGATVELTASASDGGDQVIPIPAPTAPGLLENTRYTVTVTALNDFGSNSPVVVEFFTTDVQSASVGIFPNDNSSTVTCLFARGTSALGCQVTMTIFLDTGSSLVSAPFNITRSGGSVAMATVQLEKIPTVSTLEAVVVDLEADGTRGRVEISASIALMDPTTLPPTTISPTSPLLPGVPLGNTLFIIIGAVAGFILVLLLCVIIVICVLCSNRRRRKQRSVELIQSANTDDLKDNYAYGDSTLLQPQNIVLQNGANITRNNTYDMPGPRTTAENEKVAANPTYEVPMPSPLPPKSPAENPGYAYAYARTNSSPHKGSGAGGGSVSLVPTPQRTGSGGDQAYAYAYTKTTPTSSISTNPPSSPSAPLVQNPVYGARNNMPILTPNPMYAQSEVPSLKTQPSVASSNASLPTSPPPPHTTYDVDPPPIYEEIALKRKSKSVEGGVSLDRNTSYGAFSKDDLMRTNAKLAKQTSDEGRTSESQTAPQNEQKEQNGTTV